MMTRPPTPPKRLTLTFDNGPDPTCTPGVLDLRRDRNITATFFVCAQGNELLAAMSAGTAEGRGLLERICDEGHWVGNHTLTHTVELGTTLDPEVIDREIGHNQELLGEFNPMRLFRPYMAGGILGRSTFSPPAIEYLQDNEFTLVLFNSCPRDWENPRGWPEVALADIERQDWTMMIVHDVSPFGGMSELERFLDRVLADGVEIVQEFPDDCVPIRDGRIVGNLDGLICGDEPATPRPMSIAAAATIRPYPAR
jgi:peptidoglycan-N-acetylglucosamine deacetylase